MPATYEPIATTTVSGSSTSSVSFTGISGSYSDIVFVCEIDGSVNDSTRIRFNGDSGTNYSQTDLRGNGTTATSTRTSNTVNISLSAGNSTNQISVVGSINNYSNSTTYKTLILRTNNPTDTVAGRSGLWRNTSAITSIEFSIASGNWVAGSTFTLYGIKAA